MPLFRLANRNKPLPGGLSVHDACVNYQAPPFASFTVQVNGVLAARLGNPGLCRRYRLKSDYASCEEYVDLYLGKLAHDKGMTGYYVTCSEGGGDPAASPFHFRHPNPRGVGQAANLAAVGVATLAEMFGADGPVDKATAESRVTVCCECPMNDKGDWTKIFTVPGAVAVRKLLELVKGEQFATSRDSELKICSACGCPLKCKVWTRKEHILKHMPDDDKAALHCDCWITKP